MYASTLYVEESAEAKGLSSAKETGLAFNISQSMNLLKHFLKTSAP